MTIVHDGSDQDTENVLKEEFRYFPNDLISHVFNRGLGPSINEGLVHVDALRKWDVNPPLLTVYVQDDVQYTPGWLPLLSQKFLQLEKPLNLGFASGIESIEHPVKKDLGNGMILKDWIRATCMMARHEYWMSMWPISKIDPETGRERGRPHDGLGSSVDWWFVRNHPNSVCRTGRTNLVMPGLMQHLGYNKSTWLDRELPESVSDKQAIIDHDPVVLAKKKRDVLPMVECGVYSCKNLKVQGDTLCPSCLQDYEKDPEAYK